MNLDGVDVFVKVISLGSFTKAAQQMKKPVTTVSDKVAQLERRLGVTLVHRTTRQLHLTSVGKVFYEKCLRALSEFDEVEQEIQLIKSEPQGRLRLTMPVDVAHSIVPKLAKKFLKKYPKVQLDLIVTNRKVDLVGEGVDLAIRVGRMVDSSYRVRKFTEAASSFWATPEFLKNYAIPKTPKQFEKWPFVSFASLKGSKIELTRNKEKIKLQLNSCVYVDDMTMVKQLVMQSIGIGMFPDFICEKEENEGSLVRLLPEWTWSSFPLSFIYPEQKFVSLNVKAFIDLALQETF